MDKLASNIIDMIKEEQIKLGYRKEKIRLYYPLSSLNMMYGTQMDSAQMVIKLRESFTASKDIFGKTEVSCRADRFCILLPEEVSEYVNEHTEKKGFLYDFVDLISTHGINIDDVLGIFHRYSDHVFYQRMTDEEFDHLIYFADGQPDAYRYCLTEEGHHIIYHRYTKEDYEELFPN